MGTDRDCCGEDVRKDQEGENLVALAEVARGDDVEEDDGGKKQSGDFVGARVGAGAAEEVQTQERGCGFQQSDEEFRGESAREMQRVAQKYGYSGEPDDERRVGVENFGAVKLGTRKPAARHHKEPELIMTGSW